MKAEIKWTEMNYVYAYIRWKFNVVEGAFIFKLEDLYLYTRFQNFVNGIGFLDRYTKWILQKNSYYFGCA